jgi:DNA-binding NarL/FixJ family response regulator
MALHTNQSLAVKTGDMIRITFAVEHQLFAEGLIALLNMDECRFAGYVTNHIKLIRSVHQNYPAVVIFDLSFSVSDELQILGKCLLTFPSLKIMVLSTNYEHKVAEELKKIGVCAYMLKHSNAHQFIDVFKQVMAGGQHFYKPPEISASWLDLKVKVGYINKPNLTKRELEILGLIRDKYSSVNIANRLSLSIYTVETHRKNIIHKLGVKSLNGMANFPFE